MTYYFPLLSFFRNILSLFPNKSKTTYCLLFLLFLLSYSILCANAQSPSTIKGKIIDERGLPLPGVTIFLTGTKIATSSDTSGTFTLSHLTPGNYQIVAKLIGYKAFIQQLVINEINISLSIQLYPDIKELKEVVIKPDKKWFQNFLFFKKAFLGNSQNALACKILNAETLSFDYNENTGILKAEANNTLSINNNALGYRLKYLLTSFEYNLKTNAVIYQGYPYFEDLKGTADQMLKWNKNRQSTYLGSIHHFIKSLYNGTSQSDKFLIYKVNGWQRFTSKHLTAKEVSLSLGPMNADTMILNDKNLKHLFSITPLCIIFTEANEPEDFATYSLRNLSNGQDIPKGQISILNFNQTVTIDQNGSFAPSTGIFIEGFMGWKKIGDLVPYNYQIK